MKLFWCVDIFGMEKRETAQLGAFLKLFLKGTKPKVTAMYVASYLESELVPLFSQFSTATLKKVVFDRFQMKIKESHLAVKRNARLVAIEPSYSVAKVVQRACKELQKSDFNIAVVQTHSRGWLSRMILGSFSRAFLYASPISILYINPNVRLPKRIETIVLADDLSPKAIKARVFTARLAKSLGAQVVIVHSNFVYRWSKKEGLKRNTAYCQKIEKDLAQAVQFFEGQGVKVNSVLNGRIDGAVRDILDSAKRKRANLTIVTARTGRLEALIGGSVTQKVLYASRTPVLVFKA